MNVYDFDGTIYRGDSTIDFFLYALKKKPYIIRYVWGQICGIFLYKIGKIDKTELKERFFAFLPSLDTKKLLLEFWEKHGQKVYDWYLQQKEEDDIIISASPEFLLTPICDKLGITRLIASKVDVQTGKFEGKNCKGEEKVKRLYAEYNITSINKFYSDSLSDLPLAKIAKEAYLVKKGKINGWRIF